MLICYDCANLINGRLAYTEIPDPSAPEFNLEVAHVDGQRVNEYRNPPSKKRKCGECGQMRQRFMEFTTPAVERAARMEKK